MIAYLISGAYIFSSVFVIHCFVYSLFVLFVVQ